MIIYRLPAMEEATRSQIRKTILVTIVIIILLSSVLYFNRSRDSEPCIDYSSDINFKIMDHSLDSEDNLIQLVRYGETQSFPAQEGFNSTNDLDYGVIKLDPDGDLIFSKRFGGEERDEAMHLQTDSEDNIILTGFEDDTVFMTKLSSSGEIVWKKAVSDYKYGYVEVAASGYYIIEPGRLYKYNKTSGDLIWEYITTAEDFGWFSPAWDSHTLDNHDRITTVYWKDNGVYLEQVSSSGELNWNASISALHHSSIRKVIHDASDNIYITGEVGRGNFNVTNSIQSSNQGGDDGFITKFSSNGSLVQSTYFGGSSVDIIHDAVTIGNDLYFLGTTESDDIPTKDAFDDTYSEDGYTEDLMMGKISEEGTLVWSTYFGNSYQQFERDYFLATDGQRIYLAGIEQRSQLPFNYVDKYTQFSSNVSRSDEADAPYDIVMAQFNTDGTLHRGQILGGRSNDVLVGLSFDSSQDMVMVGVTNSDDLPQIGHDGMEFNGNVRFHDMFAMKLNQQHDLIWSRYLITELPFDTC